MSRKTFDDNSPRPKSSGFEQWEELVRGAGDAIIVCSHEGLVTMWNGAAERLFGFSQPEALGCSLDIIIPERFRQQHWDGYRRTMETGVTKYSSDILRVPALHKDGHVLSIAFTVSLLLSREHRVQAIAAIIRDETQRYAEERDIRNRLAALERGHTPAA